MGHLSIVNLETLKNILETGYVSTKGTLKLNDNKSHTIEKTIADLFSDVLAMRINDKIYPWIVKGKKQLTPNIGFKYRFKVSGSPIFVQNEKYPIKVPVESKYLEYEKEVSEAKALDIFREEKLWNAIGKKSLRKGRSITHQTPCEDNILEELLGNFQQKFLHKKHLQGKKISIDLTQTRDKLQNFIKDLKEKSKNSKNDKKEVLLQQINIEDIQWVKNSEFLVEKALEAWIMENIDKNNNNLSEYFPRDTQLIWFGNYLPFGVLGENIDIVLIHTNTKKVISSTIIELKKGKLSKKSIEEAIEQVKKYALFIQKALKLKRSNTYPMIISHISTVDSRNVNSINFNTDISNPINLIGYEIQKKRVIFRKIN